jgi:hypothetical protein
MCERPVVRLLECLEASGRVVHDLDGIGVLSSRTPDRVTSLAFSGTGLYGPKDVDRLADNSPLSAQPHGNRPSRPQPQH